METIISPFLQSLIQQGQWDFSQLPRVRSLIFQEAAMARAGRLCTSTYSPDVIVLSRSPTDKDQRLALSQKNSVLGKRWRLPLGTHGTLIFPKKIRSWCGESTVAFWNIAVTMQQLKAFATDILSYGSERTQDARQWRPMYLHGRVVDPLSCSPRQWTAG